MLFRSLYLITAENLDTEINLGSLHPLENDCYSSLLTKDIENIIKQCNFTKETPSLGTRIQSGGILVQRMGTITKVKENTDYRLLTAESPILVFTNKLIKLENEELDMVFEPLGLAQNTRLVNSRLTSKNIENLKEKLKWEQLFEGLDTEDYTRYSALGLQGILYLIVAVIVVLTIKFRNKLKKLQLPNENRKSRKNILKSNKSLLRQSKV